MKRRRDWGLVGVVVAVLVGWACWCPGQAMAFLLAAAT